MESEDNDDTSRLGTTHQQNACSLGGFPRFRQAQSRIPRVKPKLGQHKRRVWNINFSLIIRLLRLKMAKDLMENLFSIFKFQAPCMEGILCVKRLTNVGLS
jgi:hypothetical protein